MLVATILVLLDSCVTAGVLILSVLLRDRLFPGLIGMEPFSPVRTYASLWPALVLLVGVRAAMGLYPGFGRSEPEELRTQTQSILLVFGVGAVGGTFFRFNEDYSRAVLGITVAMLLPSLPLFRAVAKRAMSGFEWYGTRVHVLGRGPRYRAIVELLQRNATLGLRPTAAEGPSRPAKHCILVPDRLSVPLPAMLDQLNRQYRRVWLVPDLLDVSSVWVTARDLRGHLALEISNNLLEPRRRLFKRGIDIAVSAAFLPLLVVAFFVVGLWIRLDSKGPVLFAQERLGRSGRRFKMLKFRTMHPNASTLLHDVLTADPEAREGWDAFQKLRVDPRVTRAGKWLRRASLTSCRS